MTIRPRKWLAALVTAVRTALGALRGLAAVVRPEVFTLSPVVGRGSGNPAGGRGRSL